MGKRERPDVVSRRMASVTPPELAVHSPQDQQGVKYRVHFRDLPGRQDIVIDDLGLAIFGHGYFGQSHMGCKRARRPAPNRGFWAVRLDGNIVRDGRVQEELRLLNWDVLVLWECQPPPKALMPLFRDAPFFAPVAMRYIMSTTTDASAPSDGRGAFPYQMTISRMTIDKLGVRLYDKVSAVIAELISNSYDADATKVIVRAPIGETLATKSGGVLRDKGYTIEIVDDGIGMTPRELNDYYLRVGSERQNDERGDESRKLKRLVMGRKGVGKLAPFGICETIEVLTSGGSEVDGVDEHGKASYGYPTAHIILERSKILAERDFDYKPDVGKLDGIVRAATGTTVTLRNFAKRQVPDMEPFEQQIAQRFGIKSSSWEVALVDNLKAPGTAGATKLVGEFIAEQMPETSVRFGADGSISGPTGADLTGLAAKVEVEGKSYPIFGWMGYAKKAFKDDLIVGVRIYCRGKIAAQTNLFDTPSGFEGEWSIRSYLIGEIHCDWLASPEDLIQTDRRDILWSHELGQGLQKWGQQIVRALGRMTRNPVRAQALASFRDRSDYEKKIGRRSTHPGWAGRGLAIVFGLAA